MSPNRPKFHGRWAMGGLLIAWIGSVVVGLAVYVWGPCTNIDCYYDDLPPHWIGVPLAAVGTTIYALPFIAGVGVAAGFIGGLVTNWPGSHRPTPGAG
jgi:hypothetical protein